MTYDTNNIFAKIIRGEIPCQKVYEDDSILAFHDIQPAAKEHILVIPKLNYISFDDFVQNASASEVQYFFKTLQKIAQDRGLSETGYRLIMNHGPHSGQEVPHFHAHILGGERIGPLNAK